MAHSLADVHAAGAVDVDLDLPGGQLTWRDLGGGVVATARCASILTWSPNARSVLWSQHDAGLAAAGAPVVGALAGADTLTGGQGAAGAERLALRAAHEAGWPELIRAPEGAQLRFLAVDEVEVTGPPVGLSRRLRALAARLERGHDVEEVAGHARGLGQALRASGAVGLEGLLHAGIAQELDRLVGVGETDPKALVRGLEAAAALLHEGRPPDLAQPGTLVQALRLWHEGLGRDAALGQALAGAVGELAASPRVLPRAAALLAAARADGLPFEVLADALQQLAPPGPASAGLWRAIAAAAPARAELVTLFNLGLSLRTEAGAPEAAMELFARALDMDPDDAELWFELGNARRDLGDADGALSAWVRAGELDPKLPGPWAGMGRLLLAQGRHQEARQALARLVNLVDEAEHWHAYGQALQGCGRAEQAREALERAERGYSAGLERGEDPRLRYRRGAVRARLGRPAEALADLQAAVSAHPSWAQIAREDDDFATLRGLPGWPGRL
ncbi:tetratricopeptide repeat protein [Myxococcota bacterium]|nr:tetratricopeptide repeat protein [Myxococcota bacterium]